MSQNTEDVYKELKKNKIKNLTFKKVEINNKYKEEIKQKIMKINKIAKIIFTIISFLILNIYTIFNSVQAININSANIISGGECGSLLTYKGNPVVVNYTQYTYNGTTYPAYCLDKTKQGVSNEISYSVSIQNTISDVKLWRIIINGYPYKTIEQLQCINKEEAFTATKQAIYCYIHNNNPQDYAPIGEAGNRTLNALKQILREAENCTETQISNTIKIKKEQEKFEIDNTQKEYVSKIYSIQAGTTISNYKVELQKNETELPEEIKITDLNNNPKQEFSQNEKFKILIPIKNLTTASNFKITIKTQINNKPILYGKAEDSTYQDYALTAAIYEDASGETQENYFKNETKVKIIKQDKETKERLENVEFNILDNNKQIIYSNLKTNKEGEIEIKNLIPGIYYIQETNTKEDYLLNEELIKFDISLNEELTITIDNLFEKKPEIEITTNTKEISKTVEKKLPVTGM